VNGKQARGYRHLQAAGKEARTTSQHSLGIVTEAGTLELIASLGDRSPMARTPTSAAAAAHAHANGLPGQVTTSYATTRSAPNNIATTTTTTTITTPGPTTLTIITSNGNNIGVGPSTPTTSRYGHHQGDGTPNAGSARRHAEMVHQGELLNLLSSYKPVNQAGEIMPTTVSYHPPPSPLPLNTTASSITTISNNSTAREISSHEPSTAAVSTLSSPTARDAVSRQARRRSNVSASSNASGGSKDLIINGTNIALALSSHATTAASPLSSPNSPIAKGMIVSSNTDLPITHIEPTIPSLTPGGGGVDILPITNVQSEAIVTTTTATTLPSSSSSVLSAASSPALVPLSTADGLPAVALAGISASTLLLQHSLGGNGHASLHFPGTATPPDTGRQPRAGRLRSDSLEPVALHVHHSTSSSISGMIGAMTTTVPSIVPMSTSTSIMDEKEQQQFQQSQSLSRRGSLMALRARTAAATAAHIREEEEKDNRMGPLGMHIKEGRRSGKLADIRPTPKERRLMVSDSGATSEALTHRHILSVGHQNALNNTTLVGSTMSSNGSNGSPLHADSLAPAANDINRKFSFVGSMVTYQDTTTGVSKDLFFPTGARPLPTVTSASAPSIAPLASSQSNASTSSLTNGNGATAISVTTSTPTASAGCGGAGNDGHAMNFSTPTSTRIGPSATTSPGSVTVSLMVHSTPQSSPSLTITPSPAINTIPSLTSPFSPSPSPLLGALQTVPMTSMSSSSATLVDLASPSPSSVPPSIVTVTLANSSTGPPTPLAASGAVSPHGGTSGNDGPSGHHHGPSTSSLHRRWSSRKLGPLSTPTSHINGGKKVNLSSLFGPPPPVAKKASTLTDSQREVLIEQAKAIAAEFIANDGPKQVNIADEIQKDILLRIERGDVDRTLFVAAQDAILKLMDGDSFM
jgi:hypothetical protein